MSNHYHQNHAPDKKRVTVLGGGAWGTALATMAVNLGHDVRLYARDAQTVNDINLHNYNQRYLPDIALPEALHATQDAQAALKEAEIVLAVIPAQAFGPAFEELHSYVPENVPLVLCAKGIERSTGRFMSDIAENIAPRQPIAALSGPSFAADVARGLPTAVTIAARDSGLAHELAQIFSGLIFRCYASTDLIGVEIGGALKNVLALAAGVSTGRGLGASAQAALVTRGFAELRRIATARGGKPETMTGLAVLGDLMLTCSSPQSRNYSYGIALGAGKPTDHLPLAEGIATAPVAARLCEELGLDAPIIQAIAAILDGRLSVDDALTELITRPLKFED